VKLEATEEVHVQDAAAGLANLAQKFQQNSEPEILGPVPAPLTRLRDKHRWQLLIKGKNLRTLHSFLQRLEGEVASLTKGGRVRVAIDVDPEYMM
jgi:primosomal protein N' (replication factor Y)